MTTKTSTEKIEAVLEKTSARIVDLLAEIRIEAADRIAASLNGCTDPTERRRST